MNVKKTFGDRVKRGLLGWTQEALAEKMDISTNYVSGIERGIENPTFDMLIKLSASLKVDMQEMFDFGHEKSPKQLRKELLSYSKGVKDEDLKQAIRIIKAVSR